MTTLELCRAVQDGALDPDTAAAQLADMRPENLIEVIEWCKRRGYAADVVGRWVWISFDAKPGQATRDELKAAGFRWNPNRGDWCHNCGHPSTRSRGWHPRVKYGSIPVGEVDTAGAVA
jgi:hypothetical protein